MNYKRKEIEKFIEGELIDEIKKQLQILSEEEREKVREDFDNIKRKIRETLGDDAFENGELKESFKNILLGREYYEKKKQLEAIKISEDLERQIYNHLITFFSRYYDKGDYISKRSMGKMKNMLFLIMARGFTLLVQQRTILHKNHRIFQEIYF